MAQLIDRLTGLPVLVAREAPAGTDVDFVTPEEATEGLLRGDFRAPENRLVVHRAGKIAIGPFDPDTWRRYGLVLATDTEAEAFRSARNARTEASVRAAESTVERTAQFEDFRRRLVNRMFVLGYHDPTDLEPEEWRRIERSVAGRPVAGAFIASAADRRRAVAAIRSERNRPRPRWEREQREAMDEANEREVLRRAIERPLGATFAFSAGVARGGLVGLPDIAVALVGGEAARATAEMEQEFPTAVGAGELVGAMVGVPGVAAGETWGLAARLGGRGAAATVGRALARAAGTGAVAAIETGTRTAARGLRDIAAAGGDITSEQSLGDRRLVAESALASAPDGALWAAGIDLALGAFGGVARRGARFLLGVPAAMTERGALRATTGADAVDYLAARSSGAMLRDVRLAEREASDLGGFVGLGREGQRLGYVRGDWSNVHSVSSAAESRIGEQIGQAYHALDRAAQAEGGDASWMAIDYVRRAMRNVVRPLRRGATEEAQRGARSAVRELYVFATRAGVLREVIDDLGMRAPQRMPRPHRIGIEWLWQRRRELDNLAYKAGRHEAPQRLADRADILQMLARSLRGTVEDGVANWAPRFGETPDLLDQIRQLNRDFRVSQWWSRASERRMLAGMANRSASLTDMLAGVAGAGAGSASGTAQAAIAGVAAGAVNKTMRERFAPWAAIAGNRMRALGLLDGARHEAQSNIARIVRDVRRNAVRPTLFFTLFEQIRDKLENEARDRIGLFSDMANDPQSALDAAMRQTATFADAAPQTAAIAAQAGWRAVRWIAQATPSPMPHDPLRPDEPPRYAPAALDGLARRMAVAVDPHAAIEASLAGAWSPEVREGLAVIWPALREDLVTQLAATAADDPEAFAAMPYATRVAFAMTLGATADATLTSRFARTLDAARETSAPRAVAASRVPQRARGRSRLFPLGRSAPT